MKTLGFAFFFLVKDPQLTEFARDNLIMFFYSQLQNPSYRVRLFTLL